MNKTLFNTLKITISAMIAVYIAKLMKLDFYMAAGIVTILTIQTTKKETVQVALTRFIAFILATIIALVSFTIFGLNEIGFAVYLLAYLLICQWKKWYSSMAMNSVLITHFLSMGEMTPSGITNEFLLFIIGVGLGIIANLHLHQDYGSIDLLKQKTDDQIKHILERMSLRVMKKLDNYDGHCFTILNDLITQAKLVGKENYDNVVFNIDDYDNEYISMREHQSQILFEMYKLIRAMNTTPFTAKLISEFLHRISIEYSVENDCALLLEEFHKIDSQMKQMPLPTLRNEFEDRARLFSLLRLTEEFLTIKKEFTKHK